MGKKKKKKTNYGQNKIRLSLDENPNVWLGFGCYTQIRSIKKKEKKVWQHQEKIKTWHSHTQIRSIKKKKKKVWQHQDKIKTWHFHLLNNLLINPHKHNILTTYPTSAQQPSFSSTVLHLSVSVFCKFINHQASMAKLKGNISLPIPLFCVQSANMQ